MSAIKGISRGAAKKGQATGERAGGTSATSKKQSGTAKELQHLRRVELLELLLDEINRSEQAAAQVEELTTLVDRLKRKLDEKDDQKERLIERLDDKDDQIRILKERLAEKDDAIAELADRVERLAKAAGLIASPSELAEIERRALEDYFDLKTSTAKHAG